LRSLFTAGALAVIGYSKILARGIGPDAPRCSLSNQ
jgi:hypothetical protein